MIIYKDIVTGDEIISDTWNMKEIDDVVYEIDCKKVNKAGNENFDIGANPSAEEADEGVESTSSQVIDTVDAFRLNYLGDEAAGTRAFGTKKEYAAQLKTYLKTVVRKLKENDASEEAIKQFQAGVQNYYTKIVGPNFKDYDFYVGESMDPDGMVILLNYREDGMTPFMTVWKHGLTEYKV